MRTALLASPALLALVACSGESVSYSPSLTQIRIQEVIVDDPPPIPEALWVPGINVRSEDYDLDGQVPAALDLSVMRDIEDPEALEKHASYDYSTGIGGLIDEREDESEMQFDDVEQGAIGDCFMVAALSATIYVDADHAIRDGLIRAVEDDQGRPTYFVVRFYDAWGNPQDIELDADLVRKGSRITYARSLDTTSSHEEWWVSLVEKAYAKWHGGYEPIGEGGWAGDVMQAITGSTATYRSMKYMSDRSIYSAIRSNLDRDRAVVAGTFGEDDDVDYSGTHIYAWHAYSVLDAHEEDGEYTIKLRNPWGEVEPAGNGADDGIFDLDMAEFRRLYKGLTLGGSHTVDHTAPDEVDDLQVEEIGPDSVTLSFTASGDDEDEGLAAKYDLRMCEEDITDGNFYDCAEVGIAGPQAPGTRESVLVSGLEEGTTWYFALRVEDESENLSGISNTVSVTVEGETDDEPAIPWERFVEFEDGEAGFTPSGLWHLTDHRAQSGTHAWWFGDADTLSYDTGSRVSGTLVSPKYDTAGVDSPAMLWDQVVDVEDGAGTDRAWLEVSTEAGGFDDWTVVWEKEDVGEDWDTGYAELHDYSNQIIRLRFRFDSMDERDNGTEGWIIDDLWMTTD